MGNAAQPQWLPSALDVPTFSDETASLPWAKLKEHMMNEVPLNFLERNWWLPLVRGIAAVLFGIGAFAWPGLTVAVLVMLFGAYALVDGVVGVVDSIRYRDRIANWGLWLLEGVLGIVVGALTLLMPGVTAFVLLMFIAGWAIIGGVLRIVAAIQLRKQIEGEWLLVLSGVLSIMFGGLLVLLPSAGILSLAWLIGFWAVLFGAVLIALAFRLRRSGNDLSARAAIR